MRGQCSELQRGSDDFTAKLQRGLDKTVKVTMRPFTFFVQLKGVM